MLIFIIRIKRIEMKYLLVFFYLLGVVSFAHNNAYTISTIPKDTTVVRGVLNNGLEYFILKNNRPENTVEMRLTVKVGSLQEEEDQLGLAHVLEHLLFNGTKNFPKHEIINYLESIGLKFGAHLNAHTGFDETVYKLSIPSKDLEKVDTAFQILEDWARHALLEDEEIEAERGVVLEEYRSRLKGLTERIWNGAFDAFYQNTRERNRLPIGTEESILNFEPQRLRDFYHTWYRPNLMSVTIVGDIDTAYAEKKIKQHFAAWQNPKPEVPIEVYNNVPNHEGKKVKIITDPELTSTGIQISFLDEEKEAVDGAHIEEFKNGILDNILMQILNQRFQELSYQINPPFLGAQAYRSSTLITNLSSFTVGAGVAEGEVLKGVKGLYEALEKAEQFGFTEKELENAKRNILTVNESSFLTKNERYSKTLAEILIQEFKGSWALTSVDWEYNFTKEFVPKITLKDIQAQFNKYYHPNNQNLLILIPEKESQETIINKVVLEAIESVEKETNLSAYTNKELPEALMKQLPESGKIKQSDALAYDVQKLTLDNGVELYYKKTDFDTDFVSLKAFSYGGASLLSDAEAQGVANLLVYANGTGVGGFKPYEMQSILAGKQVQLNAYVGPYDEGMAGSAKTTDMESLFQWLHLYFKGVNTDEAVYRNQLNKSIEWLKNQLQNPNQVYRNAISNWYNQNDPRFINLAENNNLERIADTIPYQKVQDTYLKRFDNVADFKFFIVGDFEEAILKKQATTYLGSLPAKATREQYKLHPYELNLPSDTLIVYKGIAPKAQVQINYRHPVSYDAKSVKAMEVFTSILERKLRNAIREEKGGTYGVRVAFGHEKRPKQEYSGIISFGCDPLKAKFLAAEVIKVVESFVKEGPTTKEVESVITQWELERAKALKQNDFWLNKITSQIYWQKDLKHLFQADRWNAKITPKYVRKIASKWINKPELTAILLPEVKQQKNNL